MKRDVIQIDETKCDGCGLCIPSCKEGALKIINGKCRLVSEIFCDGLGACLGDCPKDALKIVKKEAEEYDEVKVLNNMVESSDDWVIEHLLHLAEHKETDYLKIAIDHLLKIGRSDLITSFLKSADNKKEPMKQSGGSCPGSRMVELKTLSDSTNEEVTNSELSQWPVQLHLVNPKAPYFRNKELLIMSTCAPLAYANIQQDYLKGRSVVMACPKLDITEPYVNKLAEIFSMAGIQKARIVRMEVPCCGGLSAIASKAVELSGAEIELFEDTIGINGQLKSTKQLFSTIRKSS